jgi:F0F1-type ATP synthase membrane subunit a
MSDNKKVEVNHSMSLGTILGILFIVLKLCGVIEWSWVWVLAPFWIGAIITILALIVGIIASLIGHSVIKKTK